MSCASQAQAEAPEAYANFNAFFTRPLKDGLRPLLGGDESWSQRFRNGHFATVYLSPKDYHRVHMPFGGLLRECVYVPADLYSVNQTTAENIDGLFARNERDAEHRRDRLNGA